MLTVSMLTDRGRVRTINEDAVLSDLDIGLIAAADGMGGHNAGEVASKLALESVHQFLRKSAGNDEFTWPYGVNLALSLNANRLIAAMKVANRLVFRASEERSTYTGMGSTLVAVLVEGTRMTFASVGDSRIYEMRAGVLRRLSRDDTLVEMLASEQGVEAARLRDHPMRNVLTNVIGARETLDVTATELDLEAGQLILLTTDGVHGALPADAMTSTLRDCTDMDAAVRTLVHTAVERDGRDNATALLARYTP